MEVEDDDDTMAIVEDDGAEAGAEAARTAFINTSGYLFLRLYKVLYNRLLTAKKLCEDPSTYTVADMTAHPEDYYLGKVKATGIDRIPPLSAKPTRS